MLFITCKQALHKRVFVEVCHDDLKQFLCLPHVYLYINVLTPLLYLFAMPSILDGFFNCLISVAVFKKLLS